MLFSLNAHAAENRNAVEEIAETMAKAYLQSASQEAATKVIENLASQAAKTDLSGKLGTAFAVYGLYENNRVYQQSTTNSQKYQAVAHATATLVTMMVPPAGAAAQIIVFCQDLAAEYVFNSYKLDFAKLEMEISSLERQKSELILKQWKSEASGFSFYLAREVALNKLIEEQWKKSSEKCSNSDQMNLVLLRECLENVFLMSEYLTLQESTLRQILSYEGRFVKFQDMLANKNLGMTVPELQDNQKTLSKQINSVRAQVEKTVKLISEARVSQIEDQVSAQGLQLTCESEMLNVELEIAKLKVDLKKDAENRPLLNRRLEQSEEYKNQLKGQGCKDIDFYLN